MMNSWIRQVGFPLVEVSKKNSHLELEQNIDILKSLNKDNIIAIGFKAELDQKLATKNAKKALESKKIDAICLNTLVDSSSFGTDTNEIDFITQSFTEKISNSDKLSIAFKIAKNAQRISQ